MTTPMSSPDQDAAAAMWRDYAEAHPAVTRVFDDYEVDQFGDSAELADELLDLVIGGRKRATSSLASEYRDEAEPFPVIGAHWVACDGRGTPRAVLRTIELRVAPLLQVDADFAHDEGEDDRSLESWRREHRRFFTRVCEARGTHYDEAEDLILERFAVVWPPELADRTSSG
ncbi:ASCH domain-containing protein [Paramicrobacterium sp. CJ85]|uniref:ASCH domain-containing protein n=1 Tax=Paramicrobacterium sp. CJ85 TaxID=3445355 RepID=UPI003F612D13